VDVRTKAVTEKPDVRFDARDFAQPLQINKAKNAAKIPIALC